ncbi:MAG TPA: bifunctional diaminohydroxyphosphoribosylaminopyrimidine deaminase/5-amino-6-(5-phosphoribosylamino)uracil reductase RibD [Bacteroidia bacterium]|nr:bifunctional diaminohydroxyphosphoribosylaminopyrimidine deaminase/5-amino-6-(5-phosphoribosylamino)uracil reductase RibD [Bacteroidia bacterium]
MQRCLDLAVLGKGYTAPNPMVGSLIYDEGKIVAEGYHLRYGSDHAERACLKRLSHTLSKDATLFVNMEPCNHHGKTPPCTDTIISSGIKKVVIGQQDPNPKVSGTGIERLKLCGIEVEMNVLENKCRELNKHFNKFHEDKRPYITLKWAQSSDGYMGLENKNIRISNDESTYLTHSWRAEEQSILIGSKTMNIDNPKLDVRRLKGRNPIPIILSPEGNVISTHYLLQNESTLVLSHHINPNLTAQQIKLDPEKEVLHQVLQILYAKNINSVFVEGGSITLHKFIEASLWDEAKVIIADAKLQQGIVAPTLKEKAYHQESIGSNRVHYYKNRNGAISSA